jgi:uncharacterized iron-regulated membrane protein
LICAAIWMISLVVSGIVFALMRKRELIQNRRS